MAETLQRRWWVDPIVAYMYKPNADVHIIPPLIRASEEVCHSPYSATNQRQHHVSGLLDAPTNVPKPCPNLERRSCNYISLVPKSSVQQWQRPRWRAISHCHILPRHMELAHAIRALSHHLLLNADSSFHSLRHYYIL